MFSYNSEYSFSPGGVLVVLIAVPFLMTGLNYGSKSRFSQASDVPDLFRSYSRRIPGLLHP